MDRFFRACEEHVVAGWEILKDLKFVAAVSCNSTHDEIRDLFLQGYEMVIATALEVKFFDMKLHQYVPVISTTKISDIRMYSLEWLPKLCIAVFLKIWVTSDSKYKANIHDHGSWYSEMCNLNCRLSGISLSIKIESNHENLKCGVL